MAEFASRGAGVAGITLGTIGSVGTAANLLGGNLGNLFGGNRMYGGVEGIPVTRYDLEKEQKIAELQQKLSLTEASIYTDNKLNDFRNYMETRLGTIEAQICQQNVYNATNTAALNCIQGQIAQLYSLTKLVIPNASVCPGWTTTTAA